jgi:ABC-2 type transport system permease protein
VQWLLLIVSVAFLSQAGPRHVSGPLVVAIGLGAAIVLPVLNLISLQVPNAAVLLFPAWSQTGLEGPRGVESMGQRIIFGIGQFLAFIVALIPAALVSTLSFFVVKLATNVLLAVPAAAVAAAVVLAIEAGLGIMLLGRLFERFDVSSEQTA